MYKRAQMGIGYLPQEASVFRKLSVEDNISAVLEMTKLSRKEQKEKLESLLNEFRLQHVRKSNGDVLSGGERRRTEIARALSVDPKFILLDEPFAGIDPIAVEDIQAIVAKLKYKNIGILITDHNVTETLSICDRAYLLIEGKIFKHGTAEELADDEQVRKLYLGRNFELKRKDWLHEEARGEKKITLDSVIHSVESAIRWSEKINEAESAIQRGLGRAVTGLHNEHEVSDLALDDYSKFLVELKISLQTFATETGDIEIKEKCEQLMTENRSVYSDLNTILLYLKAQKN
jgi:lipopolysaccharide export system ATP-binding protein